jgi:hypothetical protein
VPDADDRAAARIGESDRGFLRRHFRALADGIRQDLESDLPVRDPGAARRELAAYERLADWLCGRGAPPDEEALRHAAAIAALNDRENEWPRATREHLAFGALLDRWKRT